VLEEKQAQQAQQNLAAMAHISDTLQTAVQGMSSTLTAGQNTQQQTMEQRLQGLEVSNARKLEEMLIVWLIENNHLTSKERMFEVYLNIAEWGPMIYGAAEASRYYFAKEPSQLNLAECIFMASIIPKPKQVRYCFDGLRLKPYYEDFYRVILDRLVDRGLISSEEAVGVTPESVEITGPAKEYLTATQSRSPRSSLPIP
jgi:membrane peptidoglycan carboxypeptidase